MVKLNIYMINVMKYIDLPDTDLVGLFNSRHSFLFISITDTYYERRFYPYCPHLTIKVPLIVIVYKLCCTGLILSAWR